MLCRTALNIDIYRPCYSGNFRNIRLQQPSAVSAPAKPVRYILDFLISEIPLIKLGSLQNLPGGAQHKTVYV